MDTLTTHTRRVVAVMAAGAFGLTAPLVVSSLSQAAVHGHHASHRDSDGDKMPNRWERRHQLNPHKPNAHRDADRDGLQNLTEFEDGTDPQDADTDDDGIEDGDDTSPTCDDDATDDDTDDATDDDEATTQSDDDACDEDAVPTTPRLAIYTVS